MAERARRSGSRSIDLVGGWPPTPGAGQIEALLRQDPSRRGIGHLMIPGDLRAATATLLQAPTVLIATGFPQRGHPCGESDGPPGAAALGTALMRLGKAVRIVAEAELLPPLRAAAATLGCTGLKLSAFPPAGRGGMAGNLAADWRPRCVVALERPGRAADGDSYTMAGRLVSDLVAPIEDLYLELRRLGVPAVAIGDGGNEIGMGRVGPAVRRHLPQGPRIAAVSGCDHLVVAGNSNRGAYGLVAALALAAGLPLLHSPETEMRLLAAVAATGAIDGVTGLQEPGVDGVPPAAQAGWLDDLHHLLANCWQTAGQTIGAQKFHALNKTRR